MKTVPILFTFDQSLLMPAGVCITSLLDTAGPDTFYDIFILHGPGCDFSALDILKTRYDNFQLTIREVKGEFVGAYEIRGIPETAYYRLLAPELIPEYGKLLYSDVDVIIREDLARYYDIDLGDNYFGAVDNCSRLRPNVQNYLKDSLHLDYHKGYYYSGNLIINSKLILQDGLIPKFRELGKNNYEQQDMDIMNIACNGRFLALSPEFCMTAQLYSMIVTRRAEMEEIYGKEVLDATLSHGLVHYNGTKPWNGSCMNMDIWWGVYRRSLFFDERYTESFWKAQMQTLMRVPLSKRIKMVLRYPLDKKILKGTTLFQ